MSGDQKYFPYSTAPTGIITSQQM